jgi:hypothetical protein
MATTGEPEKMASLPSGERIHWASRKLKWGGPQFHGPLVVGRSGWAENIRAQGRQQLDSSRVPTRKRRRKGSPLYFTHKNYSDNIFRLLNEHISVVSYRVYIYIPDTTVASYTY